METTVQHAAPSAGLSKAFLRNKIFSLLGIFPLGIYAIVHLYGNLTSLEGAEAFNRHLESSRSGPFLGILAILFIWAPILYHGVLGMIKLKQAKPNYGTFRHWENLKYLTQRLSGIGIFLFLPAHIFKSKILPTYINGQPADFAHMVEAFSEPVTLTVYLLGTLGVAYHLANGVWQFCIGWGITTTQKGMNRVQAFAIVLFFVVLAMAWGSIWGFLR
ncbi:MAG: hypothetical protein JNL01_08135 [Bdellovibrionales bacterium]|nr:hypothetical protein [Bdellovibrionales bacterium]